MVNALARRPTLPALPDRLSVLENRDFRRLLAARGVSVLGDGLYTVAAMWLVYALSGSTAMTGLAGVLTRAPAVFKVLVGPLVDRARLGRVLVLSELAQAALVVVVPLAALWGYLDVPVVLAVMPLLAVANLFAGPAQNAAIPRIVPEDSLVRANSVGVILVKAVDASARGIAGLLIAAVGAVGVYVLDAATFVIAALLFVLVSIPARDRDPDPLSVGSYLADLRAGLGVVSESVVGRMLVASLLASFLTGATLAVLPAFADGIGGPGAYGLLLAGFTVGQVVGSGGASLVEDWPMGRVTATGMVLAAGLWIAGVALPGILATAALLTLSRVPIGVYNVSASSVLQTGVPDDLLGRVSAAVGSATGLALPAGMALGGLAGEAIGAGTVMYASGIGTALMGLYWFVVPALRRFEPPTAVTPGGFGPA